jgi:hypothetical protein
MAVAVNSGGSSVSAGGVAYLADQYFSGGLTYQVTSAIGNTVNDALYQSERYGTFSYALPVVNGSYSVTLQFAEIWFDAPGQRVFDVTAEGALVLNDLDVFSAAGGKYLAKDYVVPVTVSDGTLNLQFLSQIDSAKVSAIRVDPVSGGSSAVLVTQSGGSTAVTEGGATDTVSVVLSKQPTANVSVTVNGGADVNVAGPGGTLAGSATLTFTPSNWNTAQTVTVCSRQRHRVEGPRPPILPSRPAAPTPATTISPSHPSRSPSPITIRRSRRVSR